jgi:hypothetical protein
MSPERKKVLAMTGLNGWEGCRASRFSTDQPSGSSPGFQTSRRSGVDPDLDGSRDGVVAGG